MSEDISTTGHGQQRRVATFWLHNQDKLLYSAFIVLLCCGYAIPGCALKDFISTVSAAILSICFFSMDETKRRLVKQYLLLWMGLVGLVAFLSD